MLSLPGDIRVDRDMPFNEIPSGTLIFLDAAEVRRRLDLDRLIDVMGLETHMALFALFDPATGEPLVVMDGTYLTEMRTAAVSAAATRRSPPRTYRRSRSSAAARRRAEDVAAASLVWRAYIQDHGREV